MGTPSLSERNWEREGDEEDAADETSDPNCCDEAEEGIESLTPFPEGAVDTYRPAAVEGRESERPLGRERSSDGRD